MPPSRALTDDLRAHALSLGFDTVGITSAAPFPDALAAIIDRIDRGYFRGMGWFDHRRAVGSTNPSSRLPWARSIVAVGLAYGPALPVDGSSSQVRPGAAIVARSARGPDYHRLMRQRLRQLARWLDQRGGSGARSQWSFDAGWLVDRAVARRAGLGFYGDNACIITPRFGSWILLGAVLTSLELSPGEPVVGGCASCGACIAACPTRALVAPGVVDASRCVSYLTLEHAGSIPVALRSAIGNRLIGCDTCQDVCPHNRAARAASLPDLLAPLGIGASPDPAELLLISEAEFVRRFGGTAVWRLGRERLARNCVIVLGNVGGEGAVAASTRALKDPSAVIRGHASWALEQLGSARAPA